MHYLITKGWGEGAQVIGVFEGKTEADALDDMLRTTDPDAAAIAASLRPVEDDYDDGEGYQVEALDCVFMVRTDINNCPIQTDLWELRPDLLEGMKTGAVSFKQAAAWWGEWGMRHHQAEVELWAYIDDGKLDRSVLQKAAAVEQTVVQWEAIVRETKDKELAGVLAGAVMGVDDEEPSRDRSVAQGIG